MRDVSGAAAQLKLSERRVRQLLEAGVLQGERVAGRWLLDDEELADFERRQRPAARPWSSAAAWAVLSELAHSELRPPSSPVQRSRARQRLDSQSLAELLPQLRQRAQLMRCYAHPAALRRLEEEDGLVLAGASAAPRAHADLIAPAGHLDAYVRDDVVPALLRRFAVEKDAERPNLNLRVVAQAHWPFPPGERAAPPAVVALDLLESNDSRERRAGEALLANA